MIETTTANSKIRFVPFKDLLLWDVKRMMRKNVASDFPIVKLGTVIIEQNNREKIFERPNEDFKILGVNNKVGLFDAYIEKGRNINQPYKKVEEDWLAFNPYRINVGSIGIKLPKHQYDYISPAYVVFSCKKELNPEFLFLLFKTETFNTIICENTTGSVRQNLLFDTLSTLQIPLPSLSRQKELVNAYHKQTQLGEKQEEKAELLEEKIESYLNQAFGIKKKHRIKREKLNIVRYKDVAQWGLDFIKGFSKWEINPIYPRQKISQLCKVGSGGTPNTSRRNYYNGDIPWVKTTEVVNDLILDTEDKITKLGLENSSAKMYPIGSLIIAMYGQGITRGRTAKLGIEAATNQACAVLYNINNDIILTDFLWLYLTNEYERLRELASGNSQPNLNAGMVLDYKIQIPPKNIQKEILQEFNLMKSKIKHLQSQAEHNKSLAMKKFEQTIFII